MKKWKIVAIVALMLAMLTGCSDMIEEMARVRLTTVSFDKQDGTGGSDSVDATYGLAMPVATAPTRTGYTFDGYYDGIEGTGNQYYTAAMTSFRSWNKAVATTLYAKWTGNSYTVSFDSQSGSDPDPTSTSVTYGQVYGPLAMTTREGLTFGGWWTGEGGTGTQILSSTLVSITADQTLYAKWSFTPFIGPAGGYVFYENPSHATDEWRYLEAAPSDIVLDGSDYTHIFGYHRPDGAGAVLVGTGTGIGSGKTNTEALVSAMGNNAYITFTLENSNTTDQYAAKLCSDHVVTNDGEVYDDWFLPSRDELNLMYVNLYLNESGGFPVNNNYYWSSSEDSAHLAYLHYFDSNDRSAYNRNYSVAKVRPIRAFR